MKKIALIGVVVIALPLLLMVSRPSALQQVTIESRILLSDCYGNLGLWGETPSQLSLSPGDLVSVINKKFMPGEIHYLYQGEETLDFHINSQGVCLVNGRPFGVHYLPLSQAIDSQLAKDEIEYVHLEGELDQAVLEILQRRTSVKVLRCEKMTDESLALAAKLPNLVALDLENSQITSLGLAQLSALNLRYLSLRATKIGDEGLQALSKHTTPRGLNLWGTQVTDKGISVLSKLPHLQSLVLGYTKITDAALQTVAQLPQLQILNLWGCPITDAGLAPLAKLSKLRSLNLYYTQVQGKGLSELQKLPKLTRLYLTKNAEDEIIQLQNLSELHLYFTGITDDGVKKLAQLPKLQALNLRGAQITGEGFAAFSDHDQLRELRLGGTALNKEGIANIAQLENLIFLNISSVEQVNDTTLENLKSLKKLAFLDLYNTNVTNKGVPHLQTFAKLRWLNLSYTHVNNKCCEELAKITTLEDLRLGDTAITYVGLARLKKLDKLRLLYLVGVDINSEGIAKLNEVLPECYITK